VIFGPYYYFEGLHESADVAFPFEPVRDGQEVEIGDTRANQGRPEPQL